MEKIEKKEEVGREDWRMRGRDERAICAMPFCFDCARGGYVATYEDSKIPDEF